MLKLNQKTASVLATVVLVATSGCSGDDDAPDARPTEFSIAGGLAELPAPEGDSAILVSVADLPAVARANGLDRPDDEVSAQWLAGMTGGDADAAAAVVLPGGWDVVEPNDFTEATGFSWAEADRVAAYSSPPRAFTVFSGHLAEGDFGSEVAELDGSDGVWTFGTGEDLAANPDGDLRVDRLGRPVRLARDGDAVAVSLTTGAAEQWLSGDGERLEEDPSFSAMADALDDAGAMSAVLAATPGGSDGQAVGWLGERRAVIVHDTASEHDAAALVAPLERAYVRGRNPIDGTRYRKVLQTDDVTAVGRTVVVTVTLRSQVLLPYSLLQSRALPAPD
ncbi:hypothetical protein [Nocardioides sp. GXZ039]|uniref:hypothetical protein n=1 Tax=Nocardioides sp. GXZ039 TaxID=3136018 RepID=UPI0030F3739E